MTTEQHRPEGFIKTGEQNPDELAIHFHGKMNAAASAGLLSEIETLMLRNRAGSVTADLAEVTGFDDYGALVLLMLRRRAEREKRRFLIANIPPEAGNILSHIDFEGGASSAPSGRNRFCRLIADLGLSTISGMENFRFIFTFIGEVFMALLHILIHPRSLRGGDTLSHMEKTGVDALPIVALISFLLGLIMAFMSSIQLRQFGAGIYVASLVAFGMVSELGPIMTAIVVAGRSGSAYAAEIGTMKISEEIDALFTMGFDPIRFLALPRIVAAMAVIPLLTLFSDIFAIAGGMVVGISMLNLTPNTYIKQSIEALSMGEVVWGMTKSACFALSIACTGCLRGFQASGGASAVGNAATSAVVTSIFLIILFDSIFAVIRSYWG